MAIIGTAIDENRLNGKVGRMEAELRHFEEIGLQAAEILPHGIDVIKYGKLDSKIAAKAADICGSFGLQYSVHIPNPVNVMHRTSSGLHKQVLRASLEFSEAIGAGIFVYHPGRFLDEEDFSLGIPAIPEFERARLLQDEADHIRELSREFPKIVFCMENACTYLGKSPFCYAEQIPPLKEQVLRIGRDNVKIILDIGHLYMASKFYGFDCVEAVRTIAPMIAHTHVHDNFGTTKYPFQKQEHYLVPFGAGDCHMPIGWGDLPVKEVLNVFARDYKGMYMMELRSRYYEDTNESKENLAAILNSIEEREAC